MRYGAAAVMLAGGVPLVASARVHAARQSVRIVALPGKVVQGDRQHLEALVSRRSKCSLSVRYADGLAQALRSRRVEAKRVAWTWRVYPGAATGKAVATVRCGKAGRATRGFTVTRRAVPAQVQTIKSGLTQIPVLAGGYTTVSYGLVLANTSKDEDAVDVEVNVNLIDTSNRVVKSESDRIDAIPAGGTFYYGNTTYTDDLRQVAKLETLLRLEGHPPSVQLPVVSDVRVVGDVESGAKVLGEVKNEAAKPLSDIAQVTAVLFDSAGNVIGGTQGYLSFGLPSGGREAFELSTIFAPAELGSVRVSVEPKYD